MKTAVKPPTPAKTRRRKRIFLTETPPTAPLKHLFRPLFPALRSSPAAVSGAYSQKQIPSSQVHDELVFDLHPDEESELVPKILEQVLLKMRI
jgi:hypothetical protein